MNVPLRPCKHPGCGNLVRSGYCPEHQPKPKPRGEASASWHWMYSTPVWQQLRADQLLHEPFCCECARNGHRVRAEDVDHIADHRGDWSLFTDAGNLQSLCHSCHSRKTLETMRKNAR